MKQEANSRALVLFSGGQDSTVCLAWALARYDHVETVGFDYGQRHAVELECRLNVRAALNKLPITGTRLGQDHLLQLESLGQLSDTALTGQAEITIAESGLPTTFVPGRNLLFFTYAAALGYRRGIRHLIGGMCETDFSGYPDCRDATLKSLAETIRLGTETDFVIETPLMWLSKADSWNMADELGGEALIELILEETHSCYKGVRAERHSWGYGCGACPACELRAAGFTQWRAGATTPANA